MFKRLQILIIFCLIFPAIIHADPGSSSVKAAYVRDGYLWMKVDDGKEQQLTAKKATYDYPPQWSHDGNMLLYQKTVPGNISGAKKTSNELWVYDTATKKHQKIYYDGQNPKWSPTENIVAFIWEGVLNISDLKHFYNISLGVDDYIWQPDGKGFIASSSASLRPDGWTNPVLYTISIEEGYKDISSLTGAKKLFIIPQEVGKGNAKILAISAGSFAYSPDKKWLSFIISPTASWSMDSDMLSVISVEGTGFNVVDEVILDAEPKWASHKNLLGYIAGGGRIVFGFKNKNLKVTELPAAPTKTLTPENFAELGFTWVTDESLIVSRVKESEWSNNPKDRPKPSLYYVSLASQKQQVITAPPKNKGDYDPTFLYSAMKVAWHRKSDIAEMKGDLWIADPDGANARVWVKDVELYSFYSPSN